MKRQPITDHYGYGYFDKHVEEFREIRRAFDSAPSDDLDAKQTLYHGDISYALYQATTPVIRGGNSDFGEQNVYYRMYRLNLSKRYSLADSQAENLYEGYVDFTDNYLGEVVEQIWLDPRGQTDWSRDADSDFFEDYEKYEDMQLRKFRSRTIGLRVVRNR